MSATWRKFYSDGWYEPAFFHLPAEAKNLYFWVHISRHTMRSGVLAALPGVGQIEMGISAAAYDRAMKQLEEAGYVRQVDSFFVVIERWTVTQIRNDDDAASSAREAEALPPAVRAAWLAANEADYGRRGHPGCDAVRASLEGVTLPAPIPPPAPRATREDPYAAAAADVFTYWQKVAERPDAKLTPARDKAIRAALRSGCDVEKLRRSIDGQRKSPFHMGENPERRLWDDLTYAMRAKNVEDFVRLADGKATAPPKPKRKSILWPDWNPADSPERPESAESAKGQPDGPV